MKEKTGVAGQKVKKGPTKGGGRNGKMGVGEKGPLLNMYHGRGGGNRVEKRSAGGTGGGGKPDAEVRRSSCDPGIFQKRKKVSKRGDVGKEKISRSHDQLYLAYSGGQKGKVAARFSVGPNLGREEVQT